MATVDRAKNRPKRIPVSGAARNILTIDNQDENFVYRWVNDQDQRIRRFQQAGYEFVSDDVQVGDGPRAGEASTQGVNVAKEVGLGTVSYLMRIPKEFYLEDQAAKHDQVRATEESIYQDMKNRGFTGKIEKS